MPSELIKANLDLIYQPMVTPLLEGMAEAKAKGHKYVLYYGYRTPGQSAKLWAQGRTQPGKIVTNAGPWESVHNYGGACDFYLLGDDGKPNWETKNGEYDVLREVMSQRGFSVGVPSVPGGDKGHVQLPLSSVLGKKERDILAQLKALVIAANGDVSAAWKQLDTWGFDKALTK